MKRRNPRLEETQYVSKTKPPGSVLADKVLSARIPIEADALVRAMPEISGFVRDAILEKLEREGYLPGGYGNPIS